MALVKVSWLLSTETGVEFSEDQLAEIVDETCALYDHLGFRCEGGFMEELDEETGEPIVDTSDSAAPPTPAGSGSPKSDTAE